MDTFEQLVDIFKQFPGIGIRQAKRFVYFLLKQDDVFIQQFINTLNLSRSHIHLCQESFQFFVDENPNAVLSPIVRDTTRTREKLMIVVRNMDLETIEKTHTYDGQYFVLGNLVPMIAEDVQKFVHLAELLNLIDQRAQNDGLKEIIFATPANPEGDHTQSYILEKIRPLAEQFDLTITTLGRGLSTGTELEYIDPDTFKNAFEGRN